MMWAGLAAIVVSLGMQQALAFGSGAGWCAPKDLHNLALRYSIVVGVPAAVAYALVSPHLFAKSFANAWWIPASFAASIPITLYSGFLMAIYQGRGAFARWNITKLCRSGGWTAAVSVLIVCRAATVLNLLLVQTILIFALGTFLARGIVTLPPSGPEQRPASLRLFLGYGLAIYASTFFYMVNQQLDQYLLSLWVSPEQLGQYVAAAAVSGVLLLVPGTMGPILFSEMAQSARDARGDERKPPTPGDGLLLSCAILAPAGILLSFVGPWLVQVLYGVEFRDAGRLLRVLAPAAVALGIGQVLSEILRGAGKPMLATYGISAGAVVTVLGLVYALPRYGVWGAAWVSLTAYSVMAVAQGVLAWKFLHRGGLETHDDL